MVKQKKQLKKLKKVIRDNKALFTEEKKREISKEIGDVLWYCASLSHDIDTSLEEICQMNISKLQYRKEREVLNGSGDNR